MMNQIHAEVSKVIEAPPEAVYAVIADYNESHPAILPKHVFSGLVVEQGGVGAGTVVRVTMAALVQELQVTVSEPEPGRVLIESGSGLTTTFAVEPVGAGRSSKVTITADAAPSPGLKGWIEKVVTQALLLDELRLLAEYVQKKS
jgi:Polyketide cyclase / dehydrase and lipid transport